jgi:prepilin-type N-terminal cleavage/methylation domain-containing protein
MKRRKAFTLIELLVVIAIIALLLSILMPSLQKVKKQAQAVVDRSNIKQLYLALSMYTEDHDNRIWTGFDNCHMNASRWWMPAMIQYAGEIPKIRFCPAATKTRTAKDLVSRGIGYGKEPFTAWGYDGWLKGIADAQGYENCHFGSYAVNGWIEDRDAHLTVGDDAMKARFWRRTNKISRAETVPFLVDGQWIDCWPQPNHVPPANENDMWGANPGAMDRIVQNRHNGRENAVFMDGSSRLVGLKELWTLKWHRTYNTKGMYTLAGGANPGLWPEWMKTFEQF